MQLRDAVEADLPALGDVFRRASLAVEDGRAVLLAHPEVLELEPTAVREGRTRVALDGGQVVGFASVAPIPGGLELEDLFVDPDRFREGIGAALVADVVDRAVAQGVTRLEVTGNRSALAFYEAAGFVVVGEEPTRFGPAARLVRPLP